MTARRAALALDLRRQHHCQVKKEGPRLARAPGRRPSSSLSPSRMPDRHNGCRGPTDDGLQDRPPQRAGVQLLDVDAARCAADESWAELWVSHGANGQTPTLSLD
jgi:hypothetical protein